MSMNRFSVSKCRTILISSLLCSLLSGCQTGSVGSISSKDTVTLGSGGVAPSHDDLQLAKAHFIEGNYGLAEKHFRKTVEINGSNAAGWMGLAASYDNLGRFDLADRAYEQLLKLRGRESRILNNMGYSYYLRGDRQKARLLYNEALQLSPNAPLILANVALL